MTNILKVDILNIERKECAVVKELCIWLVILVVATLAVRYSYQIRNHKDRVSPPLSTWIIFFTGTGLSFATYLVAAKYDFGSGVLNTMDFLSVSAITLSIILWGKREEKRFSPFEKWYLASVGLVIVYWVIFRDARNSNIFAQILITVGYSPTIQKMIAKKRNTESYSMWILALVAGTIGLYPAKVDGNSLAVLYATRTIVLIPIVLIVMSYYELRSWRKWGTRS